MRTKCICKQFKMEGKSGVNQPLEKHRKGVKSNETE
jgi:hypothetical protein